MNGRERADDPHRRESVWEYPRPPRLERSSHKLRVVFAGVTIAETGHPRGHTKTEPYYVDDDRVQAQEGDFYGGWITSRVTGPFKGRPGTRGR